MTRVRSFKLAVVAALLVPSTVALADPLIPWPWLESSRYSAWKRDRDQAKADWYARRALDPIGSRKRYYKGKNWPPFPRPEGISVLPSHRYHAAHYWPYPYACYDRQSVREYINAGEEAGWMSMTTLYDYHFDRDNQELNRAGLIHLNWILRNTPQHRKVVYVQTGSNTGATQLRLVNVQNELVATLGDSVPPVVPRVTSPLGRPAVEVDAIQRADRDSQPAPRITSPLGGGGGGAGGGGSGAGVGGATPRIAPRFSNGYQGYGNRTSTNSNFNNTRTR